MANTVTRFSGLREVYSTSGGNILYVRWKIVASRASNSTSAVTYSIHFGGGWTKSSDAYITGAITGDITVQGGNQHTLTLNSGSTWRPSSTATTVTYADNGEKTIKLYNFKSVSYESGSFSNWTSGSKSVNASMSWGSTSHTWSFNLSCPDYTASPTYTKVTGTVTTPSASYYNSRTVEISGTASNGTNNAVTRVIILKGGQEVGSKNITAGNWSVTLSNPGSGVYTAKIQGTVSGYDGTATGSCTVTQIISEPPSLSVSASAYECYDNETVTLTVNVSGGTSDYTYVTGWWDYTYGRYIGTGTTIQVGPGQYDYNIQSTEGGASAVSSKITIGQKIDTLSLSVSTSTVSTIEKSTGIISSKAIQSAIATATSSGGGSISYQWKINYGSTPSLGTTVNLPGYTSAQESIVIPSTYAGKYYSIICTATSDKGGTATQSSSAKYYYPPIPSTVISFTDAKTDNVLLSRFHVSWAGLTADTNYYSPAKLLYWIGSTSGAPTEVLLTASEISSGLKEFTNGMAISSFETFAISGGQQISLQLAYSSPDDGIDGIKSSSYLVGTRSMGARVDESTIHINYASELPDRSPNFYIKPFTVNSMSDYGLTVQFNKGDITAAHSIIYRINLYNQNEYGTLNVSKYFVGAYATTATGYEVYETNSSGTRITPTPGININWTNDVITITISGSVLASLIQINSTSSFGPHWTGNPSSVPNDEYDCTTTLTAWINENGMEEDSNEKTAELYLDFKEAPIWESGKYLTVGIDYKINGTSTDLSTCDFNFGLGSKNPMRMINYKEKIAFLIPHFTDYNQDATSFKIQIARLDTNTIEDPSDFNSSFVDLTSDILINDLQNVTYGGSQYYFYEFEMPQYQYSKFLIFRVYCIDSKNNISIANYWDSYLTGSRIQPLNWSFSSSSGEFGDLASGATRAVFKRINLIYNITDNGGSLFSGEGAGLNYATFPNLTRSWIPSGLWKINYEVYYHEKTTTEEIDYFINSGTIDSLSLNSNSIHIDLTLSPSNTNFNHFKSEDKLYVRTSDTSKETYELTTDPSQVAGKTYYFAKEKLYIRAKMDYAFGTLSGATSNIDSNDWAYISSNYSNLYVDAPVYIYFAELPTIAYRKYRVGINTEEPRENSILDINESSSGAYIYLTSNVGRDIVINVNNGTIDNIIIDGGTW